MAATRRKKGIAAVLLRGNFFREGCLKGQSLRIYDSEGNARTSIASLPSESHWMFATHMRERKKYRTMRAGFIELGL